MLKNLARSFRIVFTQRRYLALSLSLLVIIILASVWIINGELIKVAATITDAATKHTLWLAVLTGTPAKIGWVGVVVGLVTAVLFSINVGMLAYAIKKNRYRNMIAASGSKQLLGLGLGALGLGCAACGSLLLVPLLALLGATSLLAILPLHGQEFGLLAIILLGYSMHQTSKNITTPSVCKA